MPPRRVIGIDAGGTKLLGGVVDEGLVVHHRVHRRWRGENLAETLDIFAGAVEEVRTAAPDVDAVGFGIPAMVDWETGRSVFSNHLPLDDVPFRDLMSERLGLPVFVDNDSNLALVAEARRGAAAGARHAALVALGTGIGGGLLLNGRLYRGASGFAAELGHICVDFDGEDCPAACPGRGCLEVQAAGNRIGRDGTAAALADPESALGRRLASGREVTGAIVTELARRLGYGLVGLVNALNPEVIVIGGGAVAAGELLLAPAREVVATRALPPSAAVVRVEAAHFGGESAMLGAAVMALEEGEV
jgi:glucokinase